MAVKTVDHHNSVLRRASRRALELEPKLAALIEPVLRGAGVKAAAAFEEKAVDHLTASALWEADAARLAAEGMVLSRSLVASLALRGAGDGVTALSTMIAVRPRQEEAERLEHVSEGSLPADKLHVTLCYLGEYDGDLGAVGEVLHRVAAQNAPLAGEVAGLGAFKEGEDGRPNILLPSVPGLIELRVQVTEALEDAGIDFSRSYGYVPHMTVGYTDDPELWPSMGDLGVELHFDDVWVVRGDQEFVQLPLVGVPPVTAAAGTPPWSAPAGDEIVDVDALVATLRTKTDPVRQAVVETTMKTTLDGAGIDFDVTNPFTAKVLAQAGSQVTNIARSTQLNVMKIVGKSYDEGLSIPDTAKAIRVGMADASVARSTLIARTELAGAVNGGSLAATQIVSDETGQGYNKQWLTAPGAQWPRHETYEGLDGQETVLEGFFQVGGDELQFPGDPAGSPEEVCNCRCAVAYVETGGAEVAQEDADNAGGFDPSELGSTLDGGDDGGPVEEYVPTPAEVGSLNAYTGNGYEHINKALRSGAPLDKFEKATVENIDHVFEKSPPYFNGKATVYRAIHSDASSIFGTDDPASLVGKEITDPAFMSSSNEPFDMNDWTTTNSAAVTIELPEGANVLYLPDIGGTKIGEENEVLLPRNTTLKILSASKDDLGVWEIRAQMVKAEPEVAAPLLPPPSVDAIEKIINPSEERPYAHWQKSTLDRQIIKSRSIVREAIAKDPTLMSLTDKERVLYERHKEKLEVLLKEREFRAGQVARPFAHLADATLARKQVALRSQLRKIADLTNPSEADLAVQKAASEQLRQITEERKYRKAHPDVEKASIAKAAPEAPVAPAGPQTPSQERMSRLKAVYASRSDAKDYQSFSRMHTAEWETQLSAAGNDFATEVEERMTARTGGQWRGHPESASVAAERRIVLNEVLSEIRPMGHAKADTDKVFKTTPNSKKLVPDAITAANWATKFYPTDWVNEAAKTTIKFVKADRGYFQEGWGGSRHELAVSGSKWAKEMTARDPMYARVAVHELAHLMEATMPDIRRAESKFYERRTKGDPLHKYGSGRKNEFVRRDEFLNEYMGKDYGQTWSSKEGGDASMMPGAGTSYEILSMGMESIFNNTNAIWTRDVDYRNFILGLLVGV